MLSALFFAAHAATVRPDLTGRFTLPGEDGRVEITIAQVNCESLTIDWRIFSYPDTAPGTYIVRVDGKARRQEQWFGRSDSTWITATWRGDHLEIAGHEAPNDSSRIQWDLALGLTTKGNLCVGARGAMVRGRLARRAGGQVETTPEDLACTAKETGGLTGVAADGGGMERAGTGTV
jgi:hypothetical protein